MKNNFTLTLLCFFLFVSSAFSQILVEGELIVRLKKGVNSTSFFEELAQNRDNSTPISSYNTFAEMLGLTVVRFDHERTNKEELIKTLAAHPQVEQIGSNFRFEEREKQPNDPGYNSQWGLEKINAPAVWECSTGGVTALGDTIVVANLESCDIEHEDLAENIWINHNEIPYDNIDNDNNGYTDDYYGWNVEFQSDFHEFNNVHGTKTAGVIGAVGDNDIGVSGVNWHVKIMVVSNNLQFDQIIASYVYIHEQRKLYNETNGQRGAFVVATNASFGASGFPEDNTFFPDWCAMYDSLGLQGVLSAGATDNAIINIDEKGDMPTSCPSDYLVAVTEIGETNDLQAGYSETMVDLAGPGSFSTVPNNNYDSFNGTSSASPHVAGAIALMYSLPCTDFAQLALDNPAEAALSMKSYILDGATPLNSLEGKTVTGGVLDLKVSMDVMQGDCGSPTGTMDFLDIYPNPVREEVTIEYRTPDNSKYEIRVYDMIGRLVYEGSVEPLKFEAKQIKIPVSNWASGIYFISIENISNIVSSKFMVQ